MTMYGEFPWLMVKHRHVQLSHFMFWEYKILGAQFPIPESNECILRSLQTCSFGHTSLEDSGLKQNPTILQYVLFEMKKVPCAMKSHRKIRIMVDFISSVSSNRITTVISCSKSCFNQDEVLFDPISIAFMLTISPCRRRNNWHHSTHLLSP